MFEFKDTSKKILKLFKTLIEGVTPTINPPFNSFFPLFLLISVLICGDI